MAQPTTRKVTSLLFGGLAATGMLTALGPAPVAQATCISAFGISSSSDCTSGFGSVAIAIGSGAQAHAYGLLGAAFAFGTNAEAITSPGGIANLAATVGDKSQSRTGGYISAAIAGGTNVSVEAGFLQIIGLPNIGNVAVSLFNGSIPGTAVRAIGVGNLASNLFGDAVVYSEGYFNNASNIGGVANIFASGILSRGINLFGQGVAIEAGGAGDGIANVALNAFGSNRIVKAGPGPLTLAVALGGVTDVTKVEPGVNINGFKLPNTAASTQPAAATRRSVERPAASSTAKTTRPAAVVAGRNN